MSTFRTTPFRPGQQVCTHRGAQGTVAQIRSGVSVDYPGCGRHWYSYSDAEKFLVAAVAK